MTDLYIFDPNDKLLAILSNEAEGACAFWSAPFKEILNKGSTFEFTCQGDHEDSQYIVAENQVAFQDKDGDFRLFVIREPEDLDGQDGPQIHAVCEPAMLELTDEVVTDKRPYNTTALDALTSYLSGTRWQVGTVADLGTNSSNAYYEYVTDAITDVINTWGGELKDRITVDQTGITGRYIDLLTRRGADIGKVWEMDKDIISFNHQVQSYPKTALFGRGSSLETDSGGFTRRLTFADVEWSVANGDPVDKPLGQEWVGDPDALALYGRLNADGSLRHRFGIFEDSEQKDAATLLLSTWDSLQQQKNPIENFEMDVFLLGDLIGYEHEKVRLGDTTFAINRNFAKPIQVEERIISFEYDIADPDNSGKVELGDYIDLFTDDERLDKVEAKLNDKSGLIDVANEPVTDNDFPDTVPPVPTGFTANGLFKIIQLIWDFDSSSYIAAYEIYASQVAGFTPDASNLAFRGKVGAYNHQADTDQQWYFRLRAVNTHGTASDFTAEVTAQTVQINGSIDIAPLTITDELIAENASIDFAKIANVVITGGMIDVQYLSSIVANLGTVTAGTLTGVTINASTFNATYTGGTSTQYGNTKLDSGELYFYEYSNTGGQAYSDIYVNTKHTVDGISYDLERPNIGYKKYTINSNGITYDGSGDQMFGGFHLTVDRATGNVSFASTQGPMTIDTKGGAINNSYINVKSPHSFNAATHPNGFTGTLQSSLGYNTEGFPYPYGMVHWFGSYSANDGGGLQLWVPYRINADGSQAGDGPFMYRTGMYPSNGWSSWRQFVSKNSSGEIDQTMTFDGAHYLETNAIDHNGVGDHIYIRPDSVGEVRATVKGSTTTYVPMRASSFPTSSLAEYKDNITEWTDSVWDIVKGMTLYQYELKTDIANGITKVRHGFVIGGGYNTPPDLVMAPDQEAVEQYLMNSLSLKHAQESANKIDNHENRLANVETLFPIVNDHESRIAALEAKIA